MSGLITPGTSPCKLASESISYEVRLSPVDNHVVTIAISSLFFVMECTIRCIALRYIRVSLRHSIMEPKPRTVKAFPEVFLRVCHPFETDWARGFRRGNCRLQYFWSIQKLSLFWRQHFQIYWVPSQKLKTEVEKWRIIRNPSDISACSQSLFSTWRSTLHYRWWKLESTHLNRFPLFKFW